MNPAAGSVARPESGIWPRLLERPLRGLRTVFDAFFRNALLHRELIAMLRLRRVFWILVLGTAATSLIPLLGWPRAGQNLIDPRQGQQLFFVCLLTQMLGAALILPAFTSSLLAGEHERDTYELLHTTFLSPLAIIVAKLMASVSFLFIYLVATAPAVVFIYLMGGIAGSMIRDAYLILVGGIISLALVALTVSSRCRSTLHALLRGLFWVLFWGGGLSLLLVMLGLIFFDSWRRGPPGSAFACMGISPVMALGFSVMPTPAGAPLGLSFSSFYLIWAGVLGGTHLGYLLYRVRSVAFDDSRPRRRWWGGRTRSSTDSTPRAPRRPLVVHLAIRLGEAGLPLVSNPVFLKEIRAEFFGRAWYQRLTLFGTLGLFVLITLIPEGASDNFIGMGIILLIAIGFLLPGILATSMTREVESGNLDLLRGTLTPLWKIYLGKTLGGLLGIFGLCLGGFLVMGGLLALGVLFPTMYHPSWGQWNMGFSSSKALGFLAESTVLMVIIFGLTLSFLVAASLAFASFCRRNLSALLGVYVTVLLVYLVIPVVMLLIVDALGTRAFWIGESLSPVSTWVELVSKSFHQHRSESGGLVATPEFFVPRLATFIIFYGSWTVILAAAAAVGMLTRQQRDS